MGGVQLRLRGREVLNLYLWEVEGGCDDGGSSGRVMFLKDHLSLKMCTITNFLKTASLSHKFTNHTIHL